jgi:heme/copper-type cytochrome/quinol oxidase subunit 3
MPVHVKHTAPRQQTGGDRSGMLRGLALTIFLGLCFGAA